MNKVEFSLIDPFGLTSNFLKEWIDENPFVEAHTSGSTGTPKKIRLLKKDMIRSAEATCSFFGLDSESTLLCPLSTDYIAGKMMIVRAIVSHSKLIVVPPSSCIFPKIEETVDLLPIVPAQIEMICNSPYSDKVRNVIVGGAPINNIQKRKIIAESFKAYSSYGMTETCSHIALSPITKENEVYEALPGISLDITKEQCLVINAPHFSFKTLVTRDVVELIDACHFKWKGRLDNVINSGGIKFFPEIIESKIEPEIKKWKTISDFYISKRPSEKWGEEIILVLETQVEIDKKTLIEDLRKILPDSRMLPKDIILHKLFLRTGSGKIRRI